MGYNQVIDQSPNRSSPPRRIGLVLSGAAFVLSILGCPGSAKDFGILFPGDGGPDASDGGISLIDGAPPPDAAPPGDSAPSGDASSCAPKGLIAQCDALKNTGCAQGACYIVNTNTTGCVCPAGQSKEGDACNTTIDCGPGLVCAGTKAPGICRTLCDPTNDTCSGGTQCVKINTFNALGFCQAKT